MRRGLLVGVGIFRVFLVDPFPALCQQAFHVSFIDFLLVFLHHLVVPGNIFLQHFEVGVHANGYFPDHILVVDFRL